MKNQIDSNFAIAILALVAACVGFSFWFYSHNNSDDQVINTEGAVTQNVTDQELVPADELLSGSSPTPEGWNTFTDEDGVFSVRYPDGYKAEKFQSTNNPPGYVELTGADECHPITITKYTNSKNIAQVGELLSFKGRLEEVFFKEYHLSYNYRDVEQKEINNYPFIFSESMPYVIAAATVTDDWIIEILTTDQYGGTYIEQGCRELFLMTLSTFSLEQ